ncbi:unnamed protein product [Prunus armeniaca]
MRRQGHRQRYTQTYGVDYWGTFALLAKLNTGDLKGEIYMDLPHGILVTFKEGVVFKLRKSLYGLKQSPRAWFMREMEIERPD